MTAPEPDEAGRAPEALGTRGFRVLTALFVLSGAAGLVDQVCFSKYLTYVVGATAHAVSAVLAAFMSGLAIGAMLGGRFAHRFRRPLAAYGVAEVAAGLTVASAPVAYAVLAPVYVALARSMGGSLPLLFLLRWILAVAIVIIPTIAMGATLPLVSAALSREHSERGATRRAGRLSALYAANTFGGAAGALAGAYLLLPSLGLSMTLYVSSAVSVLVGIASLLLARRTAEPLAAEAAPVEPMRRATPSVRVAASPGAAWLLSLAALSGALAFTTEVVATHLLAVIVGNSVYAFGLILSAFLSWLFAGASLSGWFARRFGSAALPSSLALTALAFAVTLPLWDDLPFLFADLGERITSFEGRETIRGAVAFGILALPVTTMGLTFPLLLRLAAAERDVSPLVGRLGAANTLGAVVGALAAGYLVLPMLGSERSLLAVASVFGALAVAFAAREGPPDRRALGVAACAVVVGLLSPRWDMGRLTAGTNVYFGAPRRSARLLSVREDVHGGITTVTVEGGVHTLLTNGKFQGNDSGEVQAQRYFAHYPCLFVKNFDRALVIGLGTGTTLGTHAAYPWKWIDLLEISPAIIDAAGRFFSDLNGHVLTDPRVHVFVDDARNHLLVHQERYDLIGMELSSIWFSGAASLYSREYYRLVRSHLTEHGVFQQWVQLHHVRAHVFAAILDTLRREFAHVALFFGGGQGILVSSSEPLTWSFRRSLALSTGPRMVPTLPNGRPLTVLAADMLAMDEGLDRFLATLGGRLDDRVSTDDNLLLEYETPRGNALPSGNVTPFLESIRRFGEPNQSETLDEDRRPTQLRTRQLP